jgi:predicted amidohydrolase
VSSLKVAVAQTSSLRGDVAGNIRTHLRAIQKAAVEGVNYLVFPELSLTGYEPELASSLAFSPSDKRLNPLVEAAKEHNVIVGVGVPVANEGLPKIGKLIIFPSGLVEVYEKIYLHPGEEKYFSAGISYRFLNVDGVRIANAICADTNHPQHAAHCAKEGADVYLAGVLFTKSGYIADEEKLARYASQYNMLVAIANHNMTTGGWLPCGRSAIWSAAGKIAGADETQHALVIAEFQDGAWMGRVVEI